MTTTDKMFVSTRPSILGSFRPRTFLQTIVKLDRLGWFVISTVARACFGLVTRFTQARVTGNEAEKRDTADSYLDRGKLGLAKQVCDFTSTLTDAQMTKHLIFTAGNKCGTLRNGPVSKYYLLRQRKSHQNSLDLVVICGAYYWSKQNIFAISSGMQITQPRESVLTASEKTKCCASTHMSNDATRTVSPLDVPTTMAIGDHELQTSIRCH